MEWQIEITRRAMRDLENAPQPEQRAILDHIEALSTHPANLDFKKLQGRDNEWRLRVGAWRVIFTRDNRQRLITVLRILPRRDAYR